MPNYNNKPILTIDDEEYKILIEACEEFEKQKTDKTANEKYGSPAEITIRNHLLKRKINISNKPNITIIGSKIKNNMLLLKEGVDPNQETYTPEEVKMIIEVKNNSAPSKTMKNGKQENPNKKLRLKFNELEALTNVHNFALIVLSESLLPPKSPSKWRFKEEEIKKENCKIFILVACQIYPAGGLYLKSNIEKMLQNNQMKKTEEFEKLIRYLKNL